MCYLRKQAPQGCPSLVAKLSSNMTVLLQIATGGVSQETRKARKEKQRPSSRSAFALWKLRPRAAEPQREPDVVRFNAPLPRKGCVLPAPDGGCSGSPAALPLHRSALRRLPHLIALALVSALPPARARAERR